MKTQLFVWCIIFLVWGCTGSKDPIKIPDNPPRNTTGNTTIEESALYRNNTTLVQGHFVNRANPQTIDYKQRGESIYRIKFEVPVVVAVGGGGEGWGYFQFPKISLGENNTIQVAWQMKPDAVGSYGDDGFSCALSTDIGKTWVRQSTPPRVVEYIDLANGDKLSISTPKPFLLSDYQIQPIPGTNKYPLSGLPEELRAVYFNRKAAGISTWQGEMAELEDPTALRYSQNNTYFPIVWWGDMQVQADQSLLAGIYPGHYRETDGSIPRAGITFYTSTNNGRKWTYLSRIKNLPVQVDAQYPVYDYSEPALVRLSGDEHLCVIRTTGSVYSPMFGFLSKDKGKTWGSPVIVGPNGVLPRLLQLGNGITVLSSGRPGVQLRFSDDKQGARWSDPFEMIPFSDSENILTATCGYTGLLALDDTSFMLVYADFKHSTSAGTRKAIITRKVTIETM